MKVWFGLHNIPRFEKGCAVTIGNFDGVHLGHKHILKKLKSEADTRGLPAVLLCFEPQPKEYFAQRKFLTGSSRLTSLRDKLVLLERTGCLDAVVVLRFSATLASLSASDFIENILRQKLNARYVLVGDDFRFGANRQGNLALLRTQPDFVTDEVPSVIVESSRASSTRVRVLLAKGMLAEAAKLMGHNFCLSGKVIHGAKLARKLGYPTANISIPNHCYPLSGVFIVAVTGVLKDKKVYGVANFGVKPTVSDKLVPGLEVHIFDFQGTLYGQRVSVAFLHKLREERQFESLEKLRMQIELDVAQARNDLPAYVQANNE